MTAPADYLAMAKRLREPLCITLPWDAVLAEAVALLEQAAKDAKDAARYRWLRLWWVELYPTDQAGDPIDGGKIALSSTCNSLDHLIDAAMQAEEWK